MQHFIHEDGRWVPTGNLMGWDHNNESWQNAANRVGIQDHPSHKVGRPDGFYVEVHKVIRGRMFEPNHTITHLIVVTSCDDWTYYYCPGDHIMHSRFAELSIPGFTEHASAELRAASERSKAIVVEEIEEGEDKDEELKCETGPEDET